MGKSSYKRLSGGQNLRQRLVLATLSSTPVLIEDIHTDDMWPGLRFHEVSFLRLLEKICDDCAVEINDTGTYYKHQTVLYILCISLYCSSHWPKIYVCGSDCSVLRFEYCCVWAGTKLKFKPGIVMGGRNLVHDCGLTRSIGYFLEPLIVLGLFAKKPLSIKLKGIAFIVNLAFICFAYLFVLVFL